MRVASNMQRTLTCTMQRGTVQAIPATFPETLTTPSKIAQKASLLDMLNDICVSQACAASPRHRTHGTPPHTRHTPRRTACKIQPLGQRVRLRQSAAAKAARTLRTHSALRSLQELRSAAAAPSNVDAQQLCAPHACAERVCAAVWICSAVQCSGGAVAAVGDSGGCVFATAHSLRGAGIRSTRSTRA